MKGLKSFLALLILLPVLASVPAKHVCAADNGAEIEELLKTHDNVADAVVLVVGDNVIAGVRVKGIVLKSRNNEFFKEVGNMFKENLPVVSNVFITTAVKEILFLKEAKRQLSGGEEPLKIYEEVMSRAEKYHKFTVRQTADF